MTQERLYSWNVIIENYRARKIDTSGLTPHGKAVVGGTTYMDVCNEAKLIDIKINDMIPGSLEEARLVLKFCLVEGNRLAYAKHISSIPNRMCSKIENMMECGLHLDNRISHKQFNRAIANIPLVGTATVIHKKCKDVNAVLCRALSHLPPEADAELLTCTYALKYNANEQG